MFVAYLVPREDHHLVVEDGLAYVAVGATEAEARANVLAAYRKDEAEQNARAVALGYEPENNQCDDYYVCHTNEV